VRVSSALLLSLTLAGCRAVEAPAGPPDLLVFLAPGLRADPPGQAGAEAAFLEPFAGRPQLRFTAAHAQSVSGRVSLGSSLTGRYPAAIPLCGLVSGDRDGEGEQPWCSQLPAETPTLPGVLGLYGYRSVYIQTGPGAHAGLARGFDAVLELAPVSGQTDFGALAERLTGLRDAPEPLLAVVVMPDLEVQARPRLRQAMGLPGEPSLCEQGGLRAGQPRLDGQPGVPEAVTPVEPSDQSGGGPDLQPSCPPDRWDPAQDGLPGEPVPAFPWGEIDRERVLSVYAQEAARLGRGIAASLDDGAPGAWLVLSSLHGLDLGEVSGSPPAPKAFAHHELLLDRTLRVPLIFMGPGVLESVEVAQPVELLDLMPTLTGLAGATPPAGLTGQDLLAADFELDASATAYAAFGDMIYLRQGPWAASLRTLSHQASALDPALTDALARPLEDGAYRLHRVGSDPLQQREMKAEQPALAEQMRASMHALRTGPAAPPEALRSPEGFLELRLQGSEGYW
jgi:hypothetical protein